VELHATLALLLTEQKRTSEAIRHYREALRLYPDTPEVLNNLAWILATDPQAENRNGAEAARLAERACELTKRKQAGYVGTLAAALAEAGRFEEAVRTGEEAAALADSSGNTQLAKTNRKLVELYRAGHPYREQKNDVLK
jgi:Flp pilus assembly protein TadD